MISLVTALAGMEPRIARITRRVIARLVLEFICESSMCSSIRCASAKGDCDEFEKTSNR